MYNSTLINNQPIYYIDSDDPVISYLKSGQLFGYPNWLVLDEFILDNNPDSYILDCGAHIGTFAFVPGIFHNKKMILIDGATKNTECLYQTFKDKSNIEIHNKILLDIKKKCSFNADYGPFGSAWEDESGNSESTSIDEIVNNRAVSAIKLDIEGNEIDALLGAKTTLSNSKPPILMEVNGHCLRLHNKIPKNVFDILDSLDYHYFIKNDKTLIPINKNHIFPFCVIDIVAIHHDNIKYYTHLFSVVDEIPKDHLIEIAKKNYLNSNQDCKNYFDTLTLE